MVRGPVFVFSCLYGEPKVLSLGGTRTVFLMEQSLADKYISLILSNKPELTKDELMGMLEEKKKSVKASESYRMLYSIFLVAQELGVKLEQAPLDQPLKIDRLVAGMRGITLTGRVIGVSERAVATRTGEEINLSRLFIGDETGWGIAVLWREKSELPKLLSIGEDDVVQVQGGYSKDGRLGVIEVHVGNFGSVTKVQNFGQLPGRQSFFLGPSKIPEKPSLVNVAGVVKWVSPPRQFSGFRGPSEMRRITITDEEGEVQAALWGKVASLIDEDDAGRQVNIVGARVRLGPSGRVELSVDEGSAVELGGVVGEPEGETKISELREGIVPRLTCKVVKVFSEGSLSSTELAGRRFRELLIYDETGMTSLMVWGDAVDSVPELTPGEILEVSGARAKGEGRSALLSLGAYGRIRRKKSARPSLQQLGEPPLGATQVKGIQDGARNLWVEGMIFSNIRIQDINARDGSVIQRAEFNLADDTGLIRAVAWRDDVNKVRDLDRSKPVVLKWVDVRRDNLSGELTLLVSAKTEAVQR